MPEESCLRRDMPRYIDAADFLPGAVGNPDWELSAVRTAVGPFSALGRRPESMFDGVLGELFDGRFDAVVLFLPLRCFVVLLLGKVGEACWSLHTPSALTLLDGMAEKMLDRTTGAVFTSLS